MSAERALLAALALAAACGPVDETPPTALRAARRAIRPTDGTGWQNNGYPAGVTVLHWDTPGGQIRLHYTKEGKNAVPLADVDSDGVPDFVQQFGKVFDKVYATQVKALGLRPPLDDAQVHDRPDFGGDGRFDVYLLDQATNADGYVVVEACRPGVPKQCAGYLVVENDFAGFGYPTPEDGMKVLTSHEFFHAIQNAYRLEGLSRGFVEGSAVWATEQVFPEEQDFEDFLPRFFKTPQRGLDEEPAGPSDLFPYGLAVWPQFLGERYGAAVLPAILEELSERGKSATDLEAIDVVLRRDHQSSLAEGFATFARWNWFTGNRAGGGPSYKAAASYPQVQPQEVSATLPQRVSGEIGYLSTQYYRLGAPAGTRLKVTVERAQPALALHLVTGDVKQPTVVSIMPDKSSASIVSQGEVVIIAASTARADRHLPLALALTEEATPNPPPPDPPANPVGGDGGGCATLPGGRATSEAATPTLALLALGGALLGGARRRRRVRGTALAAVVVALALAGCSGSPAATFDATPDSARPDGGRDLLPRDKQLPDSSGVLGVGQFVDFVADSSGVVKGSTPTTGAEQYLLLLTSLDETPLKAHKYTATESGSQPMQGPAGGGGAGGGGDSDRRCRFHDELRQIVDSRPAALWTPKTWRAATLPPKKGEQRSFTISAGVGPAKTITAECVTVDNMAAYWLDRTTTPLATVDAQYLADLAAGFSQIIMPRERIYFGKESDLDGDGIVHIMFSPLVAAEATAYFSPCDLVDPKLVAACDASNQMEILYVTPPALMPPPYNTAKAMLETVAHELQHAIYFNRKYLLNGNGATLNVENPYVTEGLSALAQDLSGYQAGNFYVTLAGLDGVNELSVPNLTSDAVKLYVPAPSDGIMRGGGYLLLRYLFDRAGGDALDAVGQPVDKGGIAWLRAFEDSKELNTPSYTKSTGLPLAELMTGFWTALAISNRGPGGAAINPDPKLNFRPTTTDPLTQRQRGFNLFGTFHGIAGTGPKAQPLGSADGNLRAGGAEFLLLAAKAGQTALGFRVETPAAAQARARLIRVK